MRTPELLDVFINKVILALPERGKNVGPFFEARNEGYLYARLIKLCEAFKSATDWLRPRDPFDGEVQSQRKQWSEARYPECRRLLEGGNLVDPHTLQHPDLLVWLLRRDQLIASTEFMPPRMASATMLSLLWFYLSDFQI